MQAHTRVMKIYHCIENTFDYTDKRHLCSNTHILRMAIEHTSNMHTHLSSFHVVLVSSLVPVCNPTLHNVATHPSQSRLKLFIFNLNVKQH